MPRSKFPRITDQDTDTTEVIEVETEIKGATEIEQEAKVEPVTATKKKSEQRVTVKEVSFKDLLKRRRDITKEQMLKKPKVRIFIPKFGDKNGDVPLSININGYRMSLKTGMYHDLPENVAKIVAERYEQGEAAGKEFRISGDTNKEDALL